MLTIFALRKKVDLNSQSFCRNLTFNKFFVVDISCTFELNYYPFDHQNCLIILVNGNDGEEIELVEGSLIYSGSKNVLQYVIEDLEYSAFEDDNIEIRIGFTRNIGNEMLTIFIPCILICVVSIIFWSVFLYINVIEILNFF